MICGDRSTAASSRPLCAEYGVSCTTVRAALATHLHVFIVDGLHYAYPWHELEGWADENDAKLAVSLPRLGASLTYRYDLGDCWDHTIVLE